MPPEPILRLYSCAVRPYYEGDIELLAEKANNAKVARWLHDAFPHPYTIEDAKSRIARYISMSPMCHFAICTPDTASTFIGGVGLKVGKDVYYRTMEVGYWVSEDFWGRGVASEVVAAFSDWAFQRFEKLLRLEAEVFEGNRASGRVLEKAGFALEGRRRMAIQKGDVVMNSLIYCKFRETC